MTHQLELDFEDQSKFKEQSVEDQGPVIVRLKKSFSWQSTYHKYPFYLAEADPNREYAEDEIYTEIFRTGSPPVSSGKGQHDWVKAVFGIEVDLAEREVVINGIGLVEKVKDDRYCLTEAAVELGRSYARDPGGQGWRFTFAEILAKFDVRTRVVLYHMGILGYGLYFPDDPTSNGLGKKMSHAQLVSRGETVPFLTKIPEDEQMPGGRTKVFNQLLDRYRLEAFGSFLAQKVEAKGLDLSAGIEYQGGKSIFRGRKRIYPEPSTNDLHLYLKQSLSLFMDIGVLTYDPARKAWGVDYRQANEIFSPEVAADLFTDQRDELFYEALRNTYAVLADQEGLAHVRVLRDQVCDALTIPAGQRISYFNRQVARLLSEGRLSIGKTLGWHGSDTDALFGDRSKEYVKLVF